MITDEILSALLEGHLDPERERAVRREVAADPSLADRLVQLEGLAAQLDALPALPPPSLRAFGQPVPIRRRRSPALLVGMLVGLAAAALLTWVRSSSPATIHLGSTIVEPHGTLALRAASQEPPMKSLVTHGTALLAGAALTVAVTDGSATLTDADGATRELTAGDQVEVVLDAPSPPATPQRERVVAGSTAPVVDGHAAPRAMAEELERLRFENGLLQGQLQLLRGKPVPWPAKYPDGIDADDFIADLESLLPNDMPLHLERVDCEEYPCIAFFTGIGEDPDGLRASMQELGTAIGESGQFGESPGLVVQNAVADDNGEVRSAVALAVLDEDGPPASEVSDRLNHRTESEMDDLLNGFGEASGERQEDVVEY